MRSLLTPYNVLQLLLAGMGIAMERCTTHPDDVPHGLSTMR